LPFGAVLAVLAAGQAARWAVAKAQGVTIQPPLVLPSPQVGVLGSFSISGPSPSRPAMLALALAGPAAMALASLALLAAGALAGPGGEVALNAPLSITWPLQQLPADCSPWTWAGAHGLLMASLALLPHSPDGQAVLQSLHGRRAAGNLAENATYLYPLVALVCTAVVGPGWSILPFWWAWLLINFTPSAPPLPREEVTEVPVAARAAAYLALASSWIYLYPWPVGTLF